MGALLGSPIVRVAGGIVLLLVIVGALLGAGIIPFGSGAAETVEGEMAAEATPTPEPSESGEMDEVGPIYQIRDTIVNLAEPGGRRYLNASIVLEFEPSPELKEAAGLAGGNSDADVEAFKAFLEPGHSAIISDVVVNVLSSKTLAEVSTPEGKRVLKDQIRDHVNNTAIGQDFAVKNVYFRTFVVQ